MAAVPHLREVDRHYLGSMALGMAAGLLLSDRIGRGAREAAAIACLGVGLATTVPFLTRRISRRLYAPTTERGSRRLEEAIRTGATFFEEGIGEDELERVG